MKQFNHNLLTLPSLTRIDGRVRLYETPDGELYPSVTTVLSEMSDKSGLEAWRKRVGEEYANARTSRAANRGTIVHKICEQFVLNDPVDLSSEMPINVEMYRQLERVVAANVDNIRVSEGTLFSHLLKVAGTVDLVADWKGEVAVIDFKTSYNRKREDWITNYFLQTSMYAYMLWEMTRIHCKKIVILIAVEEENEAQVFEANVGDWITKARATCDQYYLKTA